MPKRKNKFRKTVDRYVDHIILGILSLPLLWLIFWLGNASIVHFWILSIVQIGLAALSNYLRWITKTGFSSIIALGLILLLACIIPMMVEETFHVSGLISTYFVFILASSWIYILIYKKRLKEQKRDIRKAIATIYPQHLPEGYIEAPADEADRKKRLWNKIVFTNTSDEHTIQVISRNKPIAKTRRRKNIDTSHKKINEINVMIKHELTELSGGEYPFIEANWTMNDVYYQLRSDGIHLPEFEKIVTSMIE